MRFGISGRGWAALVLAALVIPSAVPLGVPLFAPAPSGSAPSAAGAPTGPSASPALDPGRGPAMASPLDRPVAPPSRGFAPVGLAVNPKALYSAEPAPMGIGDFGVTSSGSGYTYSTSRFLGTARIGTMAANASGGGGGWISLQLNVVLELTHGSSKAVYWIQDVPFFDTSSRTIYFEDNVWNLSGPSAYMRSSSISGSGYVYSGGYYAAGASYGAGNGATLANPAVVEAEVVASTISGTTYVGFEYNDGYGWVTYDNVTFPWTQGWNSDGFVVNGTSYNPFGIFYDAEWVYGGPGGGSTDIDLSSDLNLTLDYSNGHNFQAVVNAYDFGSNTAETVGNVVESYPSAASSGIPRAHVQNGSGSLGLLYGRSNVAIVNATTVVPEGTIALGSVATPYSGGQANVTLLPGTYPAVLENGSTPTAAMNLSLSAGEYLSVGFPGLTISPAQAPGGTTGNASGELFVPGTTVWVNWTNGTNLCHATADSRGNFSCDFTVPAIAAGPYRLSASAGGAMPETAWQSLNVTTDLAVSLTAAQPATDVGIPLSFAASASGGYAPYGAFQWTFGDGTNLSGTNGSASHSYLRPGTFTVEVELRDHVGSLVRASVSVTIDATPTITLPSGSRASADVGQSVNFTATAALGSGLYTYMWSGLPAGCLPMAGVAVCEDLSVVGTSTVAVTVTDSFGAVVSSSALAFRTYADPTVELPTTDRMSADVGQPVAFRTNATLGSGNYSFAWVGLPSGCPGSGSAISCAWSAPGNVSVRVWATDSNGYTVGSGSVGLRIFPAPSLSTPNASRPSVDVGQSVTFSVTANGGSGGLHYAWASLPGGCDSSDSPTLVCVPTALGSAFVTVSVTDSNGVTATSMISYQTYADPTIGALRSSINATDVGVAFTLSSSAAGGSGNLTFVWTGLPTGCPGADASVVTCAATGPGRFSVVVSAVDPNGFAVTSAALEVVIAPAPTTTVVTDPSGALEGVALTIRAEVSGGTPGFHYAWRGLPSGCRASDAAAISCTPNATGTFAVTVAVTDAVGSTSNATLSVSIAPSFLGLPQWEGIGLVVAAAIAAAGAAIVLLRRRRAPPRGPGAAVAPPPSDPHPPTPP